MNTRLLFILLFPLAFAQGWAQKPSYSEGSTSIASYMPHLNSPLGGNTPAPGGAMLQYEVEPVQQFCSRGDEIPGCKRQGELYFYRSKVSAPIGRSTPRNRRSSMRLYAAAISDGKCMLQELVSRHRFASLSQLGVAWQPEEGSFIITVSSHQQKGQVTTRIAQSTFKEQDGVQESVLTFGAHPRESDFQPAIDPTGHIMVWSSDRAGGFGGTDLYWAAWEGQKWSSPHNMGGWVNTAADEGYPAFNGGGSLFFASNGLPGFGGWDIHWTRIDSGGYWLPPINAGSGINSSANDIAMVWNDPRDGNAGYFASDRVQESGMDIYAFVRYPELWVTVQDAESRLPVPGATLKLREVGLRWRSISVDTTGQVAQRLGDGEEWDMEVQAEGYYPKTIQFSTSEIPQGQNRFESIQLVPIRHLQFQGFVKDSLTGDAMQNLRWQVTSLTTMDSISSGNTDGDAITLSLEVGQDYLLTFRQGDSCSQRHVIPLRKVTGGATLSQQFDWSCGKHRSLVVVIRDSLGLPLTPSPHIVVLNAQGARLQSGAADKNGLMIASLSMKEALVQIMATQLNGSVVRVTTDPRQQENVPLHIPPVPNPKVPAHVLYFWAIGTDQVIGLQQEALQEIAFFMAQHPDYHLRAESHTDARGDAAINSELASRRSRYILDRIEAAGPIDRSRLHQHDHGESAITNGCLDGVPCTEEQHLDNRKTEIYLYRPNTTK